MNNQTNPPDIPDEDNEEVQLDPVLMLHMDRLMAGLEIPDLSDGFTVGFAAKKAGEMVEQGFGVLRDYVQMVRETTQPPDVNQLETAAVLSVIIENLPTLFLQWVVCKHMVTFREIPAYIREFYNQPTPNETVALETGE